MNSRHSLLGRKMVTLLTAITGALAVAGMTCRQPRQRRQRVDWDAIAQCESGGNWVANTGNGYLRRPAVQAGDVGRQRRYRITRDGLP